MYDDCRSQRVTNGNNQYTSTANRRPTDYSTPLVQILLRALKSRKKKGKLNGNKPSDKVKDPLKPNKDGIRGDIHHLSTLELVSIPPKIGDFVCQFIPIQIKIVLQKVQLPPPHQKKKKV